MADPRPDLLELEKRIRLLEEENELLAEGHEDALRDLAERNLSLEREIAQHRATEAALRESEQRFRTTFSTSPDAININRIGDGLYLAVNEGFTRITGWSPEDVIGRSSMELGIWVDPVDRDRLVAALREHGRYENLEARFRFKDGKTCDGLMSACVVQFAGESCILSVTRDVTAIKQAQVERDRLAEQLRQGQKMEAIGRLAGGVAHDFNNLLTVILNCSAAVAEASAAGRPADPEDAAAIHAAGERARDLTRQLLAFARRQLVEPVALDLNEVVRQAEKLLRHVLREDIALEVATARGIWSVRCDRGQLEQVLMNLAVNARDAMPEGGRLTIETRNVEILDSAAGDVPPAGAWVRLSVRDSGMGMAPEVRAHVFEPFFTTKGPGEGTGLGLATVYGIATQAAGHVQVESEPGRGTTFHVWLPRFDASPVAAAAGGRTAAPAGGSEVVLVVEDDPLVRDLTVRVLRSAGYRVLVARHGVEALEVARAEPEVALVVTDLVMPGLGGRAVAEALREVHPDLPALFVSGYSEDALAREGRVAAGEYLAKPFTSEALLARVRAILDGRVAT